MAIKLNYVDPSSKQTLLQGIQELKASEGADRDAAESVSEDLRGAIEVHDVIHVLFACPTNLRGEISAHAWTIFGTTMTVREMHSVNRHTDHRAVLKQIGHGTLVRRWLKAIPSIVDTFNRSRKMSKQWPAVEFEIHLDRPLNEIRSEYNIKLPAPISTEGSSGGASLRHIRT